MYLSHTRTADAAHRIGNSPGPRAGAGGRAGARVPATVVTLGLVSLVTDASAEMVTAILPVYLMYGLGIGYLQLGALDGLYTGATVLFRLAGGYAADRLGRPKTVATCGYGISAATKLGLPLIGASAGSVGLLLAADRTGKGIRTAPRDTLITLAAPEAHLGRAFGVHRALDTLGAMLGPLLAFAVLLALPGDYDAVFLVSFCLAAAGVVLLAFFVRADRPECPYDLCGPHGGGRGGVPTAGGGAAARSRGAAVARARVRGLRACLAPLWIPGNRRTVLAAALLGLTTVGDMFFYVALQQRMDLSSRLLPLLPVGTALVFMSAAVPLGRVADRVGRWRLFLLGHLLLLCGYLLVAGAPRSWPGAATAAVVLTLHGLFYAASDGVLMAHIGPAIPARVRTTGLAVVQTAQALARSGGAVAFGAAAALGGLGTAFGGFALALLLALLAASALRSPWRNR
ncbi:MFS transporter [Streptomyces silvensis]|uniref:MFS transporter n=1 Tax=Streptomyces silvensis TaxID=1765722 RepID=A0A0W7X1M3_9ACTN|nr:MFS transporter [Streptomyces silvensis]KUF16768.1 MFS transporter [Streptomyces silvensis]